MLVLDPFGIFYKLFFLAVAPFIVLIAHPYRELTREGHGESYAMILGVVLGMILLATASNLLMIYLALEMVSLPSYLLTGVLRRDDKSSEAGSSTCSSVPRLPGPWCTGCRCCTA